MKKKKTVLKFVAIGAAVVLEILAALYDIFFNDMHIIKPIGQSYVFRTGDLPLIIATVLLIVVVIGVVISPLLGKSAASDAADKSKTRTINPALGLLGFSGLLGFIGVPTYIYMHEVWPFFFFVFFGFFSFYYEGKLSGTFIDERFKEESMRAELKACKIGFAALWILAWGVGYIGSKLSPDIIAVVFTAGTSLIIALVLFLSKYLLYKYDTEGEKDESDEAEEGA